MDTCPLTFSQGVMRHFHLPVLLALWVLCPVPGRGFYIHREEYATNEDDTESTQAEMQPTLSWAVKFRTSTHRKTVDRTDYGEIADQIARDVSLLNHGQVGELLHHYLFVHASYNQTLNGTDKQSELQEIQRETERRLRAHPEVEWFHQQRIRKRTKRSLTFKDPSYSMQWHLHNHKTPGMDINVTEVWMHNITGTGVVVAVIDDGLEWRNEDILANYNAKGSWDLNNNDPDPMPEIHKDDGKSLNRHGTRCAGEIAAVANDKCSVGVAFNAQISGIRLLDGPMTDSLEATAFNKNMHINDIYSCSWGPDDDGKTVDGPHPLAQAALKHGVTAGRKGLGSIFVVASGNGGRNQDNCNYDGYANSMYTVTIGAVDESGQMPYYAEQCASMLAVTFSSGASNKRNIVTTDWTLAKGTGCTSSHTGTSAAAPLAAGMIALMLQAKPCLTWRDIQHIIIYTAVKIDEKNAVWITNAGGFHHSHKHGFGLMSTWRLVNAAKSWHTVPWLTSIDASVKTVNQPIVAGQTLTVTQEVPSVTAKENELQALEHVLVTVTLSHVKRGMLEVRLVCPSGTESVIGAKRKKDDSSEGLKSWTFSSVRCWGETPVGQWKLVIVDSHGGEHKKLAVAKGTLLSWKLTLYGSNMNFSEIEKRKTLVSEAMSGIFLDANMTEPCSYYLNAGYEEQGYLSSRIMKLLLYMSGMFTIMSIYYTLEQAFCNSEDKEKQKEEEENEDLERGSNERRTRGDGDEEHVSLLENVHMMSLLGGDEVYMRRYDADGKEVDRQCCVEEQETLLIDEASQHHRQREDMPQINLVGSASQPKPDMMRFSEAVFRDHGTPCTHQIEPLSASCEVDAEVSNDIPQTKIPPMTFDPEDVTSHCPGCQDTQVQYITPSVRMDSSCNDSLESKVPASMEMPSQNALPFSSCRGIQAHPFNKNLSLTNDGRPVVSLNHDGASVQSAGQCTDSHNHRNELDSSKDAVIVPHSLVVAVDTQHSIEPACSLVATPGQPFTQPIPGPLLLSAVSGQDKSHTSRTPISPFGCHHSNQKPRIALGLQPARTPIEHAFAEQTNLQPAQDTSAKTANLNSSSSKRTTHPSLFFQE